MDHPVTLVHPEEPTPGAPSSALPDDLLEQMRGRVRLLALLMLAAFAIDPILFFGAQALAKFQGRIIPDEVQRDAAFYWCDVAVVVVSAGLWLLARSSRISVTRLRAIGLGYEVVLCFVVAFRTIGEYYRDLGMLPNLTWAPAIVILFPLIMPAPPRLMLPAALAAGSMPLLALVALQSLAQVPVDGAYMFNTAMGSAIAIGFAWMGSRVVYGLGREVAAARELGSYRLEEKLGEGGMGEVWRARHRMLARGAAIKLIRPAPGVDGRPAVSADAVRRFEREAQAIAGLRSPHTVELFDFGVAQDGAFYYVMELLDGLDADRLVRRYGPVPPERAIYLLRQICHSLSEAESRGLVHRDIKPANVFLCHYGEEYDFVKVLDFGIVTAPGGSVEPAITRDAHVQGTPAFIAPEQALGEPLDGRADIYATGCVAYWLLTGEFVFTADTTMGLLVQHARSQPAPPSTRTTLPIPRALEELILCCLAKEPAHRPQSARELSRRLGGIGEARPWTPERAESWWREHRPSS
ncbi:MAG: serine/threonine-protein kinase [Gemmatimonadales bacterium]